MSVSTQVTGKISAIISNIDACCKICDDIGHDLGLSQTFENVARRLPILTHVLAELKDHYEARQTFLAHDVQETLKHTSEKCSARAQKLQVIFEKVVADGENDDWDTRSAKASQSMEEGTSVENLINAITEDVRNIVCSQAMQPTLSKHKYQLDKLLQEQKSSILSSPPGKEGVSASVHSHVGRQFNNMSDGQQFVIDTMSGVQNFNFVIRQKSFDFEKTFGSLSMRHLESIPGKQSVVKAATTPALDLSKPLFTVPLSRDPSFTGRTEILDQLSQGYHTYARMAVVGWAGVGKTQIAVEYCYRLRTQQSCPNIIWIRAETKELFMQSYAKLAKQVLLEGWNDPERDTMDLVYQWLLNDSHNSWLMILDNVDSMETFEEAVEPQSGFKTSKALISYLPDAAHISILVTSRNVSAALGLVNEPASLLNVPAMSQVEAIALLKTKLPHDKSTPQERISLVEELYCLPLAITQASAYIFKRGYKNVTRYLKQLEADKDRVLNDASADLRRDPFTSSQGHAANSVLRTWSISFEYIKQHNEKAAQLLCLLSLLQGQDFPTDVLKNNEKGYDFEYDDMVQPLVEFALVREDEGKDGISIDTISVHRLIQISVENWLRTTARWENNREQALATLASIFPDPEDPSQRLNCEYLIPHAHAVLKYQFDTKEQHESCIGLYFLCAWTYRQRGQYVEAMSDLQYASNLCKSSPATDHILVRNTMTSLTLAYLDLGLFNEAEAYARTSLEDSIRELGEMHRLSTRLMASLSEALHSNGKAAEAKRWAERYLANASSIFGSDSEMVFFGKNLLAKILNGQGQHRQAEQILRENLSRSNKVGMRTDLSVTTRLELSQSLICQGRASEAKVLLEETIATVMSVLGPNYHKLSIARSNLAVACHMSGDADSAVSICDSLLPDLIKQHGPDHHIVLKIQEIRIISSKGHGDPVRAVEKLQALQKVRKAVLNMSDVHPDYLLTRMNIGAALASLGSYTDALATTKSAVEQMVEVLGEDHYFTQRASVNLSNFYRITDNVSRAEQLSIMAIERAERTLEPYNIVTTEAKQILATTYAEKGRIEDARNLSQDALQAVSNAYPGDSSQVNNARKQHVIVLMHDRKTLLEAKMLLTQMIATNTKKYGKFNAEVGDEIFMLANIHNKLHENEIAEQVMREYVDECRQRSESSDIEIVSALNRLHAIIMKNAKLSSEGFIDAEELQTMKKMLRKAVDIDLNDEESCNPTAKVKEALLVAVEIYEIQKKASPTIDQRVRDARELISRSLCLMNAHKAALQLRRNILAEATDSSEITKCQLMSNVADTLRVKGDVDGAIGMFEDLFHMQKRILGPDHLDTLRTMNELGVCKHKAEQYREAEGIWREILRLKHGIFEPGSVSILHTENELALDLIELEKYDEALDLLQKVATGRSELLGVDDSSTLSAKHDYAYALKCKSSHTKNPELLKDAETTIREVWEARQLVLGLYHDATLGSMELLVNTLSSMTRYTDAEQLCSELIERRVQKLGKSSKVTVRTFRQRLTFQRLQSRHQDAAEQSEEIIAMYSAVFGSEHPETCQVLYETGHSMFMSGNHDKGEEQVRTAFNMLLESSSATYFLKVDCWYKMGEILEKKNNWQEVETITRQMLAKVAPDPSFEEMPLFRRRLAFALQKLGRGKEAVDTMLEHFNHYDEVYGTDHHNAQDTAFQVHQLVLACNEEGRIRPEAELALRSRCVTLFEQEDELSYNVTLDVARLYMNVGHDEAEGMFLRCSSKAQKLFGETSVRCQQPEMELGESLYLKGRYVESRDRAAQCLDQYLQRYKLAATDVTLLRVRNNLAMTTAALGQVEEARTILSDLVNIAEQTYGTKSATTLAWQCNLGYILRLCGELEQSRKVLSQNLSDRETVHGIANPALHIAQRHLAETCIDLGQYEEAAAMLKQVPAVEDVTRPLLRQLIISLACDCLRGKLQLLTNGGQTLQILTKTVKDHTDIFGSKHPHVQTAKMELARAYLQAGSEMAEAKRLLLEVDRFLEEAGASKCATAKQAQQMLQQLKSA